MLFHSVKISKSNQLILNMKAYPKNSLLPTLYWDFPHSVFLFLIIFPLLIQSVINSFMLILISLIIYNMFNTFISISLNESSCESIFYYSSVFLAFSLSIKVFYSFIYLFNLNVSNLTFLFASYNYFSFSLN